MNVINKVVKRKQTYDIDKSYIEAHKAHRLEKQAEYDRIDNIVSNFRATGGLKFEHQAYKLWALQKLLKQYQPESILELGSGSSSLVISDYVRSHDKTTFLSIDEDEKWALNTSELINIKAGEPITIKQAHKIVYPNLAPPIIKYETTIEGRYDFVLIDGPSLNIRETKLKDAINSNFCELIEIPKTILVDVRRATAEFIADTYSDRYDIILSDRFTQKPVESGYQYFSVFTKKN